jgi:D-3-phosphoglycerate dehydrogenase
MRAILVPFEPYGPWDTEAAAVEGAGCSLDVVPYDELAAHPRDAELLLNVWAGRVTEAMLDAMPSLRCAVGYGVGLDWIDVGEATRRGVAVVTMPHANTEEVATHAVALVLACARRLLELDGHVRGGGWDWSRERPFHRLRGRRAGLLAFGSIARRVAELLQTFGMTVAAHDPFVEDEEMRERGVVPVGIE